MKIQLVLMIILINAYENCLLGTSQCAKCGGDNCLLCYDAFINLSGGCTKVPIEIDHCLSYETLVSCKTCNLGYKVNNAGECEKINIEDCLQVDQNGECIMCKEGVMVKDGLCDDGNDCGIHSCRLCKSNIGIETCYKCEQGLTIYNFIDEDGFLSQECVLQNGFTINCRETILGDKTQCSECDINYFYKFGSCQKDFYDNYTLYTLEKAFLPMTLLSMILIIFIA